MTTSLSERSAKPITAARHWPDAYCEAANLRTLPEFGKYINLGVMSTMNISLPNALKSFVDDQVAQGRYGTTSEYVRELIRKDQDRLQLRGLLIAGATSAPAAPADPAYFKGLRDRVHKAAKVGSRG